MQLALDLALVYFRAAIGTAAIGAFVVLLLTPDPCLAPGTPTPIESAP